ncbi:MAG: hypothetical protein ACO3AE_05795 [Robiginitalea sp.]
MTRFLHLPGSQYNLPSPPLITVAVLLLLLVFGCAPKQESITESEVISTIEGFFETLDVTNKNPGLMDHYTTPDFLIYEAGQKMDRKQFKAFAEGSTAVETDWELSDFRISTDEHSAHASFFNRGEFVVQQDSVRIRLEIQWLESAFLVRQGDSLKIKFYFSDNIGIKSDTIR